jgi:hypothetical protein
MSGFNGWTNYETWRVYSELVQDLGMDLVEEFHADGEEITPDRISEHLWEIVSAYIHEQASGFSLNVAMEMLELVNWDEIAEHLLSEHRSDET